MVQYIVLIILCHLVFFYINFKSSYTKTKRYTSVGKRWFGCTYLLCLHMEMLRHNDCHSQLHLSLDKDERKGDNPT